MSKLPGLIALLFMSSLSNGAEVPPSMKIWEALSSIHPAASKPNDKIRDLLAKPIEVAGFTVVDEFEAGEISEFLLTPISGGCVHSPLPPPSHLIHVVMAKGKTTPNFFGQRVLVHGIVTMGTRPDSSYEMIADSVKRYP